MIYRKSYRKEIHLTILINCLNKVISIVKLYSEIDCGSSGSLGLSVGLAIIIFSLIRNLILYLLFASCRNFNCFWSVIEKRSLISDKRFCSSFSRFDNIVKYIIRRIVNIKTWHKVLIIPFV